MRRNKAHRGPGRPPKKKPSVDSLLKDIGNTTTAINVIKRMSHLPNKRRFLTALYGYRRHAERLLATNNPRIGRRVTGRPGTKTSRKVGEETERSPSPASPVTERTTKGEKIARGWRQARAIKKNYGDDPVIAEMTVPEIRREYTKFKRGLKTRVSDIMWYNPSP